MKNDTKSRPNTLLIMTDQMRGDCIGCAGHPDVKTPYLDDLAARIAMKPNIIYILADDMGYGDVSCYHEKGKISTPNIDRIANEGIRFNEAHSTSAVCTPSRYSILTGRYCWRKLAKGIVNVYGDTIIPKERKTVAHLLKKADYDTACIGKWHLGMSFCKKENGDIDFKAPLKASPVTNGFDYYFGVDVPNWPPYSFIENDKVTGELNSFFCKSGGYESVSINGPSEENWSLEAILPTITNKACDYINEHANSEKPFFIYFPLTSPHTPLAVNDEWKGKSGLNLYADFVMETDAMVGRVLDTLDKNNIAKNTLVVFTTDNGCARYIGCDELEAMGHYPSGHSRGYKSDAWDGGHKIPLVMRLPKLIKAGRVYDKPVSLGDFIATVAELTAQTLPDNMGEDSISIYPVLAGSNEAVRESIIHHSINGKFAVRKGDWKLILCAGSGGFVWECGSGYPADAAAKEQNLPKYQLYNMKDDPFERVNLYSENIQKAGELLAVLEDAIKRGRTTKGENQQNDIECIIDPDIDGDVVFDDC